MKNCIILLILFLFFSCSTKHRENENLIEKEHELRVELINDVFLNLVNRNFDKELFENHQKRNDSLDDVIILLEKFIIPNDEMFWSDNNQKYFLDSLESYVYNQIYRKITDSTLYDKSIINLSKLTNTGKFKIKKYRNNYKFWKDSTINLVATLLFSTPHFNEKYNKAMFGFTYFCGGTCGSESIVLCEKKNDRWTIFKYDEYAVY